MNRTLAIPFLLFVAAVTPCLRAEQPLHHIVLVQFKEDVPAADREAVLRAFEVLPEEVPGMTAFQWGTDNSPEGLQKGFTHAFLMTFESPAALQAYVPHPAHQALVELLRPAVEAAFVFDFHVEKTPEPAAPGRVHHLVFFKYRDAAPEAEVQKAEDAFAALERQIPGLLRYQAGVNTGGARGISRGLTHGHVVTFVDGDARDDYIPHPAHRALVEILGPILEDVLVVDFTVRPSERSLLVTGGLEPYRVYQRSEDGTATLSFGGLAGGEGPIEARLLAGRRVVDGFDWRRVGEAAAGVFRGELPGVPTGGEYTVEIRRRDPLGNIAEITAVANLLVGDIWVLAGQSNMEGYGDLVDVERPHPLVHNFTMAHRWELAVEPLHWLADSPDPVHYGNRFRELDEEGRRERRAAERRNRRKGAGLGLPFAKHLVEHTGVPVGLVSAAHGGTSLTQWDPALREKGGESLYGSMLKQVRRAGGSVRGVLWYQGESDANPDAAPLYRERFKALVAAFRADLGNPSLPFHYVQIGRFVVAGRDAGPWKTVQETQRTVWREIPGTGVVSAIDLSLDDLIHAGTSGLKRLGARLAKVVRREVHGDESVAIGPRLDSVEVGDGRRTLRVRFSGVNGRLHPGAGVHGFSLTKADGGEFPTIYNASVDPARPDTVVLRLQSPVPQNEEVSLWYGAGFDPVCNLVDSEDLAALAFGPVPVR